MSFATKRPSTKRPSTKRPSRENLLPEKLPSRKTSYPQKRPSRKLSIYKTSSPQNVLRCKTSYPQKVRLTERPSTNRPQLQNVPNYKTSPITKRPPTLTYRCTRFFFNKSRLCTGIPLHVSMHETQYKIYNSLKKWTIININLNTVLKN